MFKTQYLNILSSIENMNVSRNNKSIQLNFDNNLFHEIQDDNDIIEFASMCFVELCGSCIDINFNDLKKLIKVGADINYINDDDKFALGEAAYFNNHTLLDYLFTQVVGINVFQKNKNGEMAIDLTNDEKTRIKLQNEMCKRNHNKTYNAYKLFDHLKESFQFPTSGGHDSLHKSIVYKSTGIKISSSDIEELSFD